MPPALRALYDNPQQFNLLDGAGQTRLELAFGKKPNARTLVASPRAPQPPATPVTGRYAVPPGVVTRRLGPAPLGPASNSVVNNPANDTTAQDTQSETSIIVLPGGNLAASYNDSQEYNGANDHFTGWSISPDGGTTWTDQGALPDLPNTPGGDVGDPVFAVDNPSDSLYFATLNFNSFDTINVFKSGDNGNTFTFSQIATPGTSAGGGDAMDKPWIAVDNSGGATQGNVYVVNRDFNGGTPARDGILMFVSTDGGNTWGPDASVAPLRVDNDGTGSTQGAQVAIGPAGQIYAAYFDGNLRAIRFNSGTIAGGVITLGAPSTVTPIVSAGGNGDLGLNGGFRTNAFPQLVVNQVTGDLYITYNDVGLAAGDRADVYFTMSSNGGATWSAPVRMNDDATTNDQFMPAIAVTPDGTHVFSSWYDRRLDGTNNLIARFGVIGNATPGNVTFGANFLISSTEWPVVIGQDPVINATYMGDYDTASADNSFFYTTWGDNRDSDAAHAHEPDVFMSQIPVAGPAGCNTAIIPNALPNGNAQVFYNQTLSDANSVAPVSWSITAGALPPGMNLNGATGVISGTPTTLGSYSFTVQAIDSQPCTSTQAYTIVINENIVCSPGWNFIANQPIDLGGSSATTDGSFVYSVGGLEYSTFTDQNQLNRYNPVGNTWTTLAGAPDATTWGNVSVYSPLNNKIYVFGGTSLNTNTSTNVTRAYDIGTNTWAYMAAMPGNSSIFDAGVYYNGKIYVIGGLDFNTFTQRNTVWAYDVATDTWNTALASIPYADGFVGSGFGLFNDNIVIAGGLDIFVGDVNMAWNYNITTNTWTSLPPVPGTLYWPGHAVIANQLWLYGGRFNGVAGTTQTFIFDPGTLTYSNGASLQEPIGWSGSTGFNNTNGFEVTGFDANTGTDTTDVEMSSPGVVTTISPAGLPNPAQGVPYNQQITACCNAPYIFTMSGTLPPGLTMNGSGLISGTPSATGVYNFTVFVTDPNGCGAEQSYSLAVTCAAINLGTQLTPLQSLTYTWNATSCGTSTPLQLLFDGNVIATVDPDPAQSCSCTPQIRTYTANFSAASGTHTVGMQMAGGNTAFSWGFATVNGNQDNIINFSGGGVGDPNLCDGYTFGGFPATASAPFTLTISTALPIGTTGVPYGATIEATGGNPPYLFQITAGALPPGLSMDTSGNITGTPTTAGSYDFTVTATDADGCFSSAEFIITVNCANVITLSPPLLPKAFVNTPYSQTVTSAATQPFPNGSFESNGGVGTNTFANWTEVDQAGSFGSWDVQTGTAAPVTGFAVPAPPDGNFAAMTDQTGPSSNVLYQDFTVPATGPVAISFRLFYNNRAGSFIIPSPDTLDYTAAPNQQFRMDIMNPAAPITDVGAGVLLNLYQSNVGDPLTNNNYVTITTDISAFAGQTVRLRFAQVDNQFFQEVGIDQVQLNVTVATTFSVTAGALPPGLSLDPNTGILSGTPTTSGSYTFTITATDPNGCTGSQVYSILVACESVSVGTVTTPVTFNWLATNCSSTGNNLDLLVDGVAVGTVNPDPTTGCTCFPAMETFSTNVVLGPGSHTVGMALNPSSGFGLLSWGYAVINATQFNIVNFSAGGVGDPNLCDGAVLNFPATNVSFTQAAGAFTLPPGSVGTPYAQTVTASGGTAPYVFTITGGGLPVGLSMDPSGNITGTPLAAGTYSFLVTATDAQGCANDALLTLTIDCASITLSPSFLPKAFLNTAYAQTISASGGLAPYTLAVTYGSLPPGLSMDASGNITGTPTATGAYTFAVTATDANGCTGTWQYTIEVSCANITFSPATLPAGSVGVAYAQTITASGGAGGYVFTSSGGSLPPGLAMDASGNITGTPTTAGSFFFMVTATDSQGCSGTFFYQLTIACNPPIVLSPEFLPKGAVNNAYSQTLTAGNAAFAQIPNGGFETNGGAGTNSFASWTEVDQAGGNGSWYAQTGTLSPTSGFTVNPPPEGLFSAMSDQGGPGSHILYQDVAVPPTGITMISFELYLNNHAGAYSSPATLDFTVSPNQQFRADVMNPAAPVDDVGAGVLLNMYQTLPGNALVSGYTTVTADLTAFAGQTVRIRFAETDNQLFFEAGVDNVQIGQLAPIAATFAVTSGALPPGLTLNGSSGVISGTPTTAGAFTFTITATNGLGCSSSQIYTIEIVCNNITLAPATLPNGAVGAAYSQSLTASGGTAPYTFSETGTLPPGLSMDSSGNITGTPTTPGSFTFEVAATDAQGCANTALYTITITCATITVSPASLPNASLGAAYSQTVSASGGTGTFTFAVTYGALPPGLALDPNTGAITGTPTSVGAFTFTIMATDGNGCTGIQQYVITVSCAAIALSPSTLPTGSVGTPYSQTITAAGGTGPYAFGFTGTMPPGLTLDATGNLTGTPTATGVFDILVTATDAQGCTGSSLYTLTISCASITVSPATLPNAQVGTLYDVFVSASGGTGTYTFSAAGTLPPGTSLNTSTGEISGTVTTTGSFMFTITAADGNDCTGSQTYLITVSCAAINLSPASLPPGVVGTAYSQTISASGGAGGYVFSLGGGSLPPGLSMSGAGSITGTPTSAGNFTFVVTATDAAGCMGSSLYTLTISCAGISLAPPSLPNAQVNVAYSQTITATGGTGSITFSSSGVLPPGLTLSSGGVLSGTPTTTGTFGFTVTATDSTGCSASLAYTMSVSCAAINLSPAGLPNGNVGVAYSQTITATGGTGPYTFSANGALPPGLSLASTGVLSGTPTASGSYTFAVIATDSQGCFGSATYSVSVTALSVASASPECGPAAGGTTVTITGTNFQPGATVKFLDVPATNVVVVDSSTITADTPTSAPGAVGDITITNPGGETVTLANGWGYDFLDVPTGNPFHDFVCKLVRHGITAGCGAGDYCPTSSILRNQMAVFIIRGIHGTAYVPPPATGTLFSDVPANAFGAAFIEEAGREGVMGVGEDTTCGAGKFCPTDAVTRLSMAYILLRGEHGGSYAPPSANCGSFPFVDVTCPSNDANFVAELVTEGITAGCDATHYCPANPVTRAQMAVFMTVTFSLQ